MIFIDLCVYTSEDRFWELVVSFHRVDPEDPSHVTRFGGNCLEKQRSAKIQVSSFDELSAMLGRTRGGAAVFELFLFL